METFDIKCVTLADLCDHNHIDFDIAMREIEASDVSFGTNDDTILSKNTIEKILGFPVDLPENVFISLGS
jgi:hypothetical protein